MNKQDLAIAATPSFGPAVVTFFGIDVPIFAFALSLLTLLLTRQIAKPPPRKLTVAQEISLTSLLVIVLFLVVTGQLFVSGPLGVGSSVVWAIGLGLSGILVLELIGDVFMGWMRRLVGTFRMPGAVSEDPPSPPEE